MGGLAEVLEGVLQSILYALVGDMLPDEPIVGKLAGSFLALIPAMLIGVIASVYLCGDDKHPGWLFSPKARIPVMVVVGGSVFGALMFVVW